MFSSDPLESDWLRRIMRNLAEEGAEHIYPQNLEPSMMNTAEETHLDAFQVGFGSPTNSLKKASFHFIETVLTKMA